jgi:hypothetical protein
MKTTNTMLFEKPWHSASIGHFIKCNSIGAVCILYYRM